MRGVAAPFLGARLPLPLSMTTALPLVFLSAFKEENNCARDELHGAMNRLAIGVRISRFSGLAKSLQSKVRHDMAKVG